jgi:hypothetical protein
MSADISSIITGLRAGLDALDHTKEVWVATAPDQPHLCVSPDNIRALLDRIATLEKALAEEREATIAECAKAYAAHDRVGREWIAGSLWDSLNHEGAARVARLSTSNGGRG